jgi:Protein of unknown function (DUF3048) N-terminal domain/Protein of unknown function (DUF3048) C-terminal domain
VTASSRSIPGRPGLRRRSLGILAASAVAASVLGACGSHHRVAAPASTTTTGPPPTSTTTTQPPPPPVFPLTGMLASNPGQLRAPAVVVKIDNVDSARPQQGIGQADVVYEEMVEGGLTRLAAVFQSDYPTVVGPVRSGRLTDEFIADDLNNPVYAFSGTNANFLPILDSQPVTPVNENLEPALFYRAGPHVAPDNLYSNVTALARLSRTMTAPLPLFSYLANGNQFGGPGGAAASSIAITFPAASIYWQYRAEVGGWVRDQDGSLDADASGQAIVATNVVVMFVNYVTSGMAVGEGVPPTPIPEGVLTGTGQAWFLSAGKILRGTWSRTGLTAVATYQNLAGGPVSLVAGKTWIELVPTGDVPTVTP